MRALKAIVAGLPYGEASPRPSPTGWSLKRDAARSLARLAPQDAELQVCTDPARSLFPRADSAPLTLLQALLLGWSRSEVYEEKLLAVGLLGEVGAAQAERAKVAGLVWQLRDEVVTNLLAVLGSLERSSPLAVACVEAIGAIEAD
eukprot:SAG11_NODE_5763_length_1468_cov_1.044558_2_plen_145_part_01